MALFVSKAIVALAATAVVLSGCASIIDGKSQQIVVSTTPTGADCGLYREGLRLATIQNTPGSAVIEKSKSDIWVVCVKPQHQQAMYFNRSGISGAAFVNVIGGIFTLGISTAIGVAVDSGTGADNKYQSPVNIALVASGPDQPEGPTALPQSFDAPKPVQAASQQTGQPRAPGQEFDGLYRGTIELASGQFRPLEIRIAGAVGTGMAPYAPCPSPGRIEVAVAPFGQLTGTADIATGSACATQREEIVGSSDGERMTIVLKSSGREFTLSRVVESAAARQT